MIDNVNERVFEYHLRGRGLIESLLCVLPVLDVLDAQNGVRIPQVARRDRFAEDTGKRRRVGRAKELGGFYAFISSTQGGWTMLSSEGRYLAPRGQLASARLRKMLSSACKAKISRSDR